MPAGRPSDYNQEIAAQICARISVGESIIKITSEPGMPAEKTVYTWLFKHEEFAQEYRRARELQAEHYADEIVSLADECMVGQKTEVTSDGKTKVITGDMVDRSRLRVDARKWTCSKLLPKKYGDKVSMDVTNSDGSLSGVMIQVNFVAPEMLQAPGVQQLTQNSLNSSHIDCIDTKLLEKASK
jgi:hypothetical protein